MSIKKDMYRVIALFSLFFVFLSAGAFAVISPAGGAATPNGQYIYIPSQTAAYGSKIKVIGTPSYSRGSTEEVSGDVIQSKTVLDGYPYALTVSNNGQNLFASVSGVSGSTVICYTIEANGTLTKLSEYAMADPATTKGLALTPDNKYLYVADEGSKNVLILNVTNPSAIAYAGTIPQGVDIGLFGVAVKPDGSRLYISNRETNNGKVYVYDISTAAKKIAPVYKATLTMPGNVPASYVAVNSAGDKLLVRMLEKTSPYRDIRVYNTHNDAYNVIADVYKIKGNDFRSATPGDHTNSGRDVDTDNGFEGLSVTPNGWYMYFSHFNGPSGSAAAKWYSTLYASPLENLNNGFDRLATTNTNIWVQWGGCMQESPTEINGGWHSTDAIIAANNNRVYYTYSNGATFLSVLTTTDANVAPLAPRITYPLTGDINVVGSMTWQAAVDDGPAGNLSYAAQYILASDLETNGSSVWNDMGFSASGELSLPFTGVEKNKTYYARVLAYDGTFSSPYSYTGPFTMDPNFLPPPSWEAAYGVTSHEAVIVWAIVPSANDYRVSYRIKDSGSPWIETSWISTKYDNNSPNPNTQITGLTEKTTYEVRVRARNIAMTSDWSTLYNFYTLERPWLETIFPSSESICLMWGPEVSSTTTEVPLAQSFELQYTINGNPAWQTYTTKPLLPGTRDFSVISGLSLDWQGLTQWGTYEIRMRTVDDTGGVSAWSNSWYFSAVRGPWWVNARKVTTSSASIEWDNAPMSKFGATSYVLSYGTDTQATNWGTYTGITTSEKILNPPLNDHTTYYVKVKAIFPGGRESGWTKPISFFTLNGPEWLANYNTSTTRSSFIWNAGTGLISYEITYGLKVYPENTWTPINLVPQNRTSIADGATGLTPRKWYTAKIRGFDSSYATAWVYDDFYTIPAPAWVVWENATTNSVSITWEAVDLNFGIPCASYEVIWGTSEGFNESTKIGTKMVDVAQAGITGLTSNREYYVKVRARDDVEGGWSDWTPYPSLYVKATSEMTIDLPGPPINGTGPTIWGDLYRGATIKITGMNFGNTWGTIKFNNVIAQPGNWKNNEIVVSIPPNAVAGINSITIIKNGGTPSTTINSAVYVLDNGYILDDMEGGVWQYSTWESTMGSGKFGRAYDSPPEGVAYCSFESNTTTYYIGGGISTYGDLVTEEGISLSGLNVIKFWFKGDGTSKTVSFELVESNTAPLNQSGANEIEVWKYSVPISMSDTNWHEITINLTTEGTAKFERDANWWIGNVQLDLNKIKGYQFIMDGNGKFSVDYIRAQTYRNKTFNFVYNDPASATSNNWMSVPYENLGVSKASDFAAAIGLPNDSVVEHWNQDLQSFDVSYIVGTPAGFNDFPVSVGSVVRVALSGPVGPYVYQGYIPATETDIFKFVYNDPATATSMNWMYLPFSKSLITNTSQLATDMGLPANSTINRWNATLQSFDQTYIVGTPFGDFTLEVGDPLMVDIAGPVPDWP